MKEGTSDFYVRTLEENRRLVNQVRARFEHFVPELFQRAPRRYDGQEIDLDGAVEMVVDIRAGATPSEKLYLRRENNQARCGGGGAAGHERHHL